MNKLITLIVSVFVSAGLTGCGIQLTRGDSSVQVQNLCKNKTAWIHWMDDYRRTHNVEILPGQRANVYVAWRAFGPRLESVPVTFYLFDTLGGIDFNRDYVGGNIHAFRIRENEMRDYVWAIGNIRDTGGGITTRVDRVINLDTKKVVC